MRNLRGLVMAVMFYLVVAVVLMMVVAAFYIGVLWERSATDDVY